jgi:DNA repair exonuclease SbcCD nuclease subunit
MKIAIAADTHIGANKFGVSDEKWRAPVVELIDYAIENKLDAVALAGDIFHSRKPSPSDGKFMHDQIWRLNTAMIAFMGADGNHDDEIAKDSTSGTWAFFTAMLWARKKPAQYVWGDTNFVFLPWITPQAYGVDARMCNGNLDTQLELTQAVALDELNLMINPNLKNVLIGHAMVSYAGGTELAHSPNLQWAGKDVVFDYDALAANFDAVFLGHVHDPSQKGYIGSSQPTDWGDAEHRKGFVVIDTEYLGKVETFIPYKTSIRLLDANEDTQLGNETVHYDVARYRQDVSAGEEPSPEEVAKIREALSKTADVVESVEINVERVVAQRISGDSLAAMIPTDAVDAYLRHSSIDAKLAKDVRSKFQSVLEHSKK